MWRELHPGEPGADAIDLRLHAERLDGSERRLHDAAFAGLPDGAFVLHDDAPRLVVGGDALRRWTPAGVRRAAARPRGRAQVLTPPSLVELLRAGWEPAVPLLHPTAAS